jgi:uncharacterized protein
MRVVLDTNVIVSGLRAGLQPPAQILDLWSEGKIDVLASDATITELERVLNYPRIRQLTGFTDDQIRRFIEQFEQECLLINPEVEVEVVTQDPTDNIFLSLAVAGAAEYIVSGDRKHLLPLKSYQGIKIVTPALFISLYNQSSSG